MKIIPLTRGMVTKVDDADYDELSKVSWCAQRCPSGNQVVFYAASRQAGKLILMHRYLLGLTERSRKGDHRDGDTLNNQRHNLRVTTHSQNLHNSKRKLKGVHFYKARGNWQAYINFDGKRRNLGYFSTEAKAAAAYNFAAMHHFGDFARLNEPC